MKKYLVPAMLLCFSSFASAADVTALINQPANNPFTEFAQLKNWATENNVSELNVAVLGSVANNHPFQRMVIAKADNNQEFVLMLNKNSGAAQQLNANPNAALLYHWYKGNQNIQIRIQGTANQQNNNNAEGNMVTYTVTPESVKFAYVERGTDPININAVMYHKDENSQWHMTTSTAEYSEKSLQQQINALGHDN